MLYWIFKLETYRVNLLNNYSKTPISEHYLEHKILFDAVVKTPYSILLFKNVNIFPLVDEWAH